MRLKKNWKWKQFWLFSSLKCELNDWNFKTHTQVIQEAQTIFGHIPKEFETTFKKWVKGTEASLAAKGLYFEKENVKCIPSESDDDVSE